MTFLFMLDHLTLIEHNSSMMKVCDLGAKVAGSTPSRPQKNLFLITTA